MNDTIVYKQQAADAAVALIEPGMVVGLGSGSTASLALRALASRIWDGELSRIVGVPCSVATEKEALSLGILLGDLGDYPQIDLTIDGADEVDAQLNLIKGGGGALLREKIVAQASRRELIIVDESKLSKQLGENHALPVEVAPFGWQSQAKYIASLGGNPQLRLDPSGKPMLSDQGNYLLDCQFGPISDLTSLASELASRAGIVEHGLFLGLASQAIVAGPDGVRHIQAPHT